MYLCTEGKILAHADVDMSLLLPREEWRGRSTWEFGRTGLAGDFQLRLPGEPFSQPQQRGNTPVVSIGAELSRIDAVSNPSNLMSSTAVLAGSSVGRGGEAAASRREGAAAAGASKGRVRTWSYLAPPRKRGVITAALQRLELKPTPSRGGGSGGSALSDRDRVDGVLVGITGVSAAGELVPGTMGAGAAGDNFRVVGCGERGEVDTEDSELLETITWRWEGEFPDPASADAGGGNEGEVLGIGGGERQGEGQSRGARGPLASIKVLAPSGSAHGDGDGGVEIATGLVPWPSSACSGRQYVNVTLLSPEGSQVGSCRVCLLLSFAATATDGSAPTPAGTGTGTGVGGVEEGDEDEYEGEETSFEEESERHSSTFEDPEEGQRRSGGRGGREREMDRVSFGELDRVRTTGVQAEEPPLEGTLIAAAGGGERRMVPRSYRMSINLASVKDLENAAYVVRRYIYHTV